MRVRDPMMLKIGDRRKFLCRPGVVGNKIAVQVLKKLEDIEQAEFEELVTDEGEEA
jgi:flagellar motor switch protein FliM